MSQSFKVCPICQAQNHSDARLCSTCGTAIAEVEARALIHEGPTAWKRYDYRYGETDLFEGSMRFRGRLLSFVLLVATITVILVAGIVLARSGLGLQHSQETVNAPAARVTRQPLPTITTGPPTATFTPSPLPTMIPTETFTPQPCIRRVASGDSLIGIIARCGHTSLDIMPTVQAINGIADETRIQVGQDIVVPWPSPTFDPVATGIPAIESAARFEEAAVNADLSLLSFDPLAPTVTATLLPGVAWHKVAANENMILIALQYDTDAKALSDLNPEIEFALCDFGLTFGGPECLVNLLQGQRMRVPAPTPTPTLQPTSSGSETPTPLPIATKNTPHVISPADQSFFGLLDHITLRWVTTGTLTSDEVFRIAVSDIATDTTYTADTRDLYFIVPAIWQAIDDQRHTYMWQVSIVDVNSGNISLATDTRTFVWQGGGGSN